MHTGFEFYWFLYIVSPVVVLAFQTSVGRHKARQREKAWKIAERYIFPGTVPWPSKSSAPDCGDNAIAA